MELHLFLPSVSFRCQMQDLQLALMQVPEPLCQMLAEQQSYELLCVRHHLQVLQSHVHKPSFTLWNQILKILAVHEMFVKECRKL
jgi:hypothetical protein